VNTVWPGRSGSQFAAEVRNFSPKPPYWLLGPPSLLFIAVAYPGIFFGGGVQQIQLRTEEREDGDLGAVAP